MSGSNGSRDSLPGYRVRQPGEVVTRGDYVQIGARFYPVATDALPSVWVGHVIEDGAAFERLWTVAR